MPAFNQHRMPAINVGTHAFTFGEIQGMRQSGTSVAVGTCATEICTTLHIVQELRAISIRWFAFDE
jgi:hypothetical protein